jgi:hypothetical protein
MKAKKVYIVVGSEDGIVGAYTTINKAYDMCIEYMSQYKELLTNGANYESIPCTLKDIKKLNRREVTIFTNESRTNCSIERITLNN